MLFFGSGEDVDKKEIKDKHTVCEDIILAERSMQLRDICRRVIRQHLKNVSSVNLISLVSDLPLPHSLQCFLCFGLDMRALNDLTESNLYPFFDILTASVQLNDDVIKFCLFIANKSKSRKFQKKIVSCNCFFNASLNIWEILDENISLHMQNNTTSVPNNLQLCLQKTF